VNSLVPFFVFSIFLLQRAECVRAVRYGLGRVRGSFLGLSLAWLGLVSVWRREGVLVVAVVVAVSLEGVTIL